MASFNVNEFKRSQQTLNDEKIQFFVKKNLFNVNYDNLSKKKQDELDRMYDGKFVSEQTRINQAIENICSRRNGSSVSEIKKELKKSPTLAGLLISKDVKKQNIAERIAYRYLSESVNSLNNSTLGHNFKLYDNNREGKYVLDRNGNLVPYSRGAVKATGFKKFDFRVDVSDGSKTIRVFFFNKDTEGAGGAQDDVKLETVNTYNTALLNRDGANVKFVFMLDGAYWNGFDYIKNDGKCFMANRDNVKDILSEIASKM